MASSELDSLRAAWTTPDAASDFVVDYKGDLDRGLRHIVRELQPSWAGFADADLGIVQIAGGITNLLYRVTTPTGASVLVRVFGEKTEVLIDREKDNVVFHLLSDKGVGPTYVGRFGNGRLEGYFPARPLQPAEMGRLEVVPKIARAVGAMHRIDVPGPREPILWQVLEKWFRMVSEVSFPDSDPAQATKVGKLATLAGGGIPQIRRELDWLATKIPSPATHDGADLVAAAGGLDTPRGLAWSVASHIVFAHNDLLSGNILLMLPEGYAGAAAGAGGAGGGGGGEGGGEGGGADADGVDVRALAAAERVQLIDFEYGGWSFAGFDLANHFCEHAGFDFDLDRWYPARATQVAFLRAYLEVARPDVVARVRAPDATVGEEALLAALSDCINECALAAHIFWGMWAVIQARHSPIDFDFMSYSVLRFGGFAKHKALFFPGEPAHA